MLFFFIKNNLIMFFNELIIIFLEYKEGNIQLYDSFLRM